MSAIRTRRWTAIFALAALLFAQASVALAACSMDRGMLAGAMSMTAGEECGACEMPDQPAPMGANQCVAHCTADLQQVQQVVAIVRSPVDMPVLVVAQVLRPNSVPRGLTAPPPGAPPARVLLHSFQI